MTFLRSKIGARIALILLTLVISCSMPPVKPVTRAEYDKLRFDKYFEIENSPEEILHYLNRDGEVVFEATSKGKNTLYYIRLMATDEGIKVQSSPKE